MNLVERSVSGLAALSSAAASLTLGYWGMMAILHGRDRNITSIGFGLMGISAGCGVSALKLGWQAVRGNEK